MLQVAKPRAAVFLFHRDAVQPELAHHRPQVTGKLVGLVDLFGARRDVVIGKAVHRIAQHVGGLAEIEIERRVLVRDHAGVSFQFPASLSSPPAATRFPATP